MLDSGMTLLFSNQFFQRLAGFGLIATATLLPSGLTNAQSESSARPEAETTATGTFECTSTMRVRVPSLPGKSGIGGHILRMLAVVPDSAGWVWGQVKIGIEHLRVRLPPGTPYYECFGPGARICRSSRIDIMPEEMRNHLLGEGLKGVINWQAERPNGDDPLRTRGVEPHPEPVVDSQHPKVDQMIDALNFAERILFAGGKVDGHCKSGGGRTGVWAVLTDILINAAPRAPA